MTSDQFTASSRSFRTAPPRGVVLAGAVLFAPGVVMGFAGAATRGIDGFSLVAAFGGTDLLLVTAVALVRTSAFLTCTTGLVTVGFAPLWRTRIAVADITEVSVVAVNAFAEYGGWGVKGAARSPGGRLYSAGGSHAVSVRLRNGKRFLVAFHDVCLAEDARSVIDLTMTADRR